MTPRWESPGGRLLRRIIPVWRGVLSDELAAELDDFLDYYADELVRQLGFWIVEDARAQSLLRISDESLREAHEAYARSGDVRPLATLVEPVVGEFWAMQALLSRAAELELGSEALLEAFGSVAGERRSAELDGIVLALENRRADGWTTPEYRRTGPVDTRTAAGRATLDRRITVALEFQSPQTAAELQRVGGTNVQVRTSLGRLINAGCVSWRREGRGGRYAYSLSEGCGGRQSGAR